MRLRVIEINYNILKINEVPLNLMAVGRLGSNPGQAGMPLLVADFWVGGKPNPPSHHFLSAERRMVAKVRKKRARLQPE